MKAFIQVLEQFRWVKDMLPDLSRLGLDVVLLDYGSKHPETVEWLELAHGEDMCEVRRLGANYGNHGFYHVCPEAQGTEPYVLTDGDLDLSGVPDDAIAQILRVLEIETDMPKVGLSLSLDNLRPDIEKRVHIFEDKFWETKRASGAWFGHIDTTFAVYDPKRNDLLKRNFYMGCRLDKPYTAVHIPWHYDYNNATPDVLAYMKVAMPVAYWTTHQKELMAEQAAAQTTFQEPEPAPEVAVPKQVKKKKSQKTKEVSDGVDDQSERSGSEQDQG